MHVKEKQNGYNNHRTKALEKLGLEVLRFDNRQVLLEIDVVLQVIEERISKKIPL